MHDDVENEGCEVGALFWVAVLGSSHILPRHLLCLRSNGEGRTEKEEEREGDDKGDISA